MDTVYKESEKNYSLTYYFILIMMLPGISRIAHENWS